MDDLEPLLVYPDPPPALLAQTLDLASHRWKAVVNASAAAQHEPRDGWPGAIVVCDDDPEGAFGICRALRRRDQAITPVLLLVSGGQLGDLELREDLFDDFCLSPFHPKELEARLRHLAPHGVDIYFDNVGGDLLERVVTSGIFARGARIVQNSCTPAQPEALLARGGYAPGSLEVLCVDLHDYEHRRSEFLREAIAWYGAGRIATKDHVVEGLVNAPAHLLLAMQGGNFGRPLVRL